MEEPKKITPERAAEVSKGMDNWRGKEEGQDELWDELLLLKSKFAWQTSGNELFHLIEELKAKYILTRR